MKNKKEKNHYLSYYDFKLFLHKEKPTTISNIFYFFIEFCKIWVSYFCNSFKKSTLSFYGLKIVLILIIGSCSSILMKNYLDSFLQIILSYVDKKDIINEKLLNFINPKISIIHKMVYLTSNFAVSFFNDNYLNSLFAIIIKFYFNQFKIIFYSGKNK